MSNKVLLVDDERNILEAFKRQLRKQFAVDTALGGNEGLEIIASQGPYAVIVSDMKMPGMDGIQFLKEVRQRTPNSVRVMLTGHADLQTAMSAVNEGHIFRFLTKPCPSEWLSNTIQAGIQQYRLVMAEKELLEKTLSGSVKVLTEILGLVNPVAFGRAMRIKSYVNHIASQLNIPYAWQFELAAYLSLIGCVTLPPDTLEKVYAGSPLTSDEQGMFKKHPVIARELLVNIPRLGTVARMIEAQGQLFIRRTKSEDFKGEDMIALGGNLLKIAMDFDKLIIQGTSKDAALKEMSMHPEEYFTEAVSALKNFETGTIDEVEKAVHVRELQTSMVLNEDLRAKNGTLIAIKGQDITYTMIQRLRAFAKSVGVIEPFRVIIKNP